MDVWYFLSPHPHPMRLIEDVSDNDDDNNKFICQICNSDSVLDDANFYACDICEFYLHTSCAGFPYQIQHPYHPHISLTFRPNWSDRCRSCLQNFAESPFYWCRLCSFSMDAKCALMSLVPPGTQDQDWIKHFTHPHPLVIQSDGSKCAASSFNDHHRPPSDGGAQPLYGCANCGYNLDKSCADLLPRQIHHPSHHHHRASLALEAVASFTCGACGTHMGDRHNLGLSCGRCSFWMCLRCAEPMMVAMARGGGVRYEDHEHLLSLIENVSTTTEFSPCDGFDSYCTQPVVASSDEFKRTESTMLWCFHCEFRVHLLCGPLPSVVKHECHVDPLVLVDSLADDDSGEYYCDVCEERRDPRIRLYCCRECKYFAHIHCLYPEIVKVLRGELKDIELKTVGQAIWTIPGHKLTIDDTQQSLTLNDVISKLSAEEKDCLRGYFKWTETASPENKAKQEDSHGISGSNSFKHGDEEEINEILRLSRFTYESFEIFKSDLKDHFAKNKSCLKSSDLALKLVKVKGYMIPHSLASVLNTLLDEFGDFGSDSSKSLEFKCFVFFVICRVVKRMHSTMAKGITKNLLQEWYCHLRFAKEVGFKIDFACVQLVELVHAFFGFQAGRLKKEIPTILTRQISKLEQKLDKCNEYCGSSPKSEYMEYCLRKAAEFEWKDAFGDSLTKKDQSPPIFRLF